MARKDPLSRAMVAAMSLAVLATPITGCWQYRDSWEKALRSRASFEFQCPQDQITMTPLTTETLGNSNVPLNQGVTGCGKRAVYTATISGYVLDSARVEAGEATATPPPPPPPPAR
jgi:hypothetical protein